MQVIESQTDLQNLQQLQTESDIDGEKLAHKSKCDQASFWKERVTKKGTEEGKEKFEN